MGLLVRYFAVLHNASQAIGVLNGIYERVKPWLIAGHKLEMRITPLTRSGEQNAKFHAICSDLANSGVPWFGKRRTAAEWKVLLVSGHAIATKEGADIIPGIESEMVNIRESTALMSKARGSSLIEYSLAFCAEHGVATQEEAT
jgi:hypothetical protein